MDGVDQRRALDALVRARGLSLAALSRDLLRRNPAYLQQFIARGSPRRLAEGDRALLADYLGVDECELGGPTREAVVAVPRFAVQAAAGAGRWVDAVLPARAEPLPRTLLDRLRVAPGAASIIRVAGDSMAPTLLDGDTILVDAGSVVPGPGGGVYVLRHDDALMVKRVVADGGDWRVTSDNPASPDPGRLSPVSVAILGRVVWLSRVPG